MYGAPFLVSSSRKASHPPLRILRPEFFQNLGNRRVLLSIEPRGYEDVLQTRACTGERFLPSDLISTAIFLLYGGCSGSARFNCFQRIYYSKVREAPDTKFSRSARKSGEAVYARFRAPVIVRIRNKQGAKKEHCYRFYSGVFMSR